MNPVLVTGATGFVGRHVVESLAAREIPIRAVVRKGSRARLPSVPRLEVVETPDLFAESADWWTRVFGGVERVAHIAWVATPGEYLTSSVNLDCLAGTLALAKGAAASGVKKVLGTGTCFEYDVGHSLLSTDTPLKPTTPYAGAKAAAFHALSEWLPSQGISFVWARLFYLHGEGEHPDRLVPYLHRALSGGRRADLTSGNQVRDFLDVKEGASTLVDALLGDIEGPINVCSGIPVSVRQLAERIAARYGRPDLLNFGARPDNLVDPPYVVGLPGQVNAQEYRR